jgi:hypothetical protein
MLMSSINFTTLLNLNAIKFEIEEISMDELKAHLDRNTRAVFIDESQLYFNGRLS